MSGVLCCAVLCVCYSYKMLYQVMLLAQLPLATFATVMLAGHVIGRAAGVALAASLAPVTDQGLGAKVAGRGGTATAVLCSIAAVAAAVLAAGWWFWAPLVAGVRESIVRYAQPSTADAVQIRSASLGLRSEVLGAVAVAIREAGYHSDAVAGGPHAQGQALHVV